MIWYEKLLFTLIVVLALLAFVDLFTSVGFGWPVGAVAAALSILCTVSILERRKRESRRGQ